MNFDAYLSLRTNPDLLRTQIQKKLREKQVTITKAERLSGLGCGSLRNFIAGHTKNPTLETLNALAKALGMTLDQLLEGTEETKAEDVSKKDNAWNPNLFLKAVGSLKRLLDQKPMTIASLEEAVSTIQEIYHRECLTAEANGSKIL